MDRATIPHLFSAEYLTVEKQFSCSKAYFGSEVRFRNAELLGGSSFRGATFDDEASFYGVRFGVDEDFQLNRISRARADVRNQGIFWLAPLKFDDITINGTLNLNSAIFEACVSFSCHAQDGSLRLADATFEAKKADHEYNRKKFKGKKYEKSNALKQNRIAEISGQYETLTLSPESITIGAGFISLEGAEIQSGRLYQADSGKVVYDLLRTTLGDVDIEPSSKGAFPHYVFKRTNFDGFDFTEYRTILDKHFYSITEPIAINLAEVEYSTEELETTYQKAKIGAQRIDDSLSAGQFYVREMSYRQRRYKETVNDPDSDFSQRLRSRFRYWLNRSLELSTGYGERLWLIGANASLVIVLSWMLFFISGGVKSSGVEVPYSLNSVQSGIHGLLEVLWMNFYFSFVTFSTLGYGDIAPSNNLTQAVAAVEAIIGTILVALLVFSLGRKVER